MTDKPIIPNAMQIAEQVAGIMFEFSYRSTPWSGMPVEHQLPTEQIEDILLFGSTMKGEPAHDIDMLIIHNLLELSTYGVITKYGGVGIERRVFSLYKNENAIIAWNINVSDLIIGFSVNIQPEIGLGTTCNQYALQR